MTAPLSDVRILDFTSGVAGPWCTKLLADYGADVIKIERPRVGDPARGHGVFPDGVPHRERSALFLWLNTSKRSITLDIGCRTGRDLVLRLASTSDAAVLDQSAEELGQLGLTSEEFHRVNERLAITSVTPFGLSGPYAEWSAGNLIAFAAGGQHYLSGDPDREPLQTGGFQAQSQAGTWAFGATLAALHDARHGGRGQMVEVAGMEVMASILELYLPDYAYRHSDVLTTRRGNIASATVGIYPAEDGHIGIHVMPKNWPQLLDAMDARWMDSDERFADNRARLKNDGELSAEMYAWTTSVTKQEAYERGGRSRAPISPVNTVADLLASQHLAARKFFREIGHPETGTMRYVGSPARMPGSPAAPKRAPLLGEHNIDVYEGLLELARRDLVRLSSAGVI